MDWRRGRCKWHSHRHIEETLLLDWWLLALCNVTRLEDNESSRVVNSARHLVAPTHSTVNGGITFSVISMNDSASWRRVASKGDLRNEKSS